MVWFYDQPTTASGGASDSYVVGSACPVLGCMDPLANNYDAAADTDDGSCLYACTQAPTSDNFDTDLGTWTNAGWVLMLVVQVLLEQVLKVLQVILALLMLQVM